MLSLLVNLCSCYLFKDGVIEGHVKVEGYAVEPLETKVEFIEEKLCLLVESTDESVSLIEPEQHIQGPL